MKKKILLLSLIFVFSLSVISISTVSAEETFSFTWGSIEAVDSTQHKTMQWLQEEMTDRTDGRVEIDFYPASQLGDTDEQIDGVSIGTLDGLNMGANLMGRLGGNWILDSLPFVFESFEHRRAFNNSHLQEDRKEQLLDDYNIRIIADNWYRTPHMLVANEPIFEVEDMEGFDMRVPEARGQYLGWEAVGANPTTITWGEVYLSIRQGLADGVSSAFDIIPEMAFHEVAPYITMIESEYSYEAIMMNEDSFKSMPEDLREIFIEVFEEAGDYYDQLSDDEFDHYFDVMMEEGAKIIYVDKQPFVDKVHDDFPEELDEAGLLSIEIWEEVQELDY